MFTFFFLYSTNKAHTHTHTHKLKKELVCRRETHLIKTVRECKHICGFLEWIEILFFSFFFFFFLNIILQDYN